MQYEEKMQELTQIVSRLESGKLSLEEASKLYARGMELAADCHKVLEEAVLQVQEIPVPGETGMKEKV
ncbi:MAG: exodeoxyribonuclease VII small subunit [Oscillospiraceae bacterium]|nr:exodeoxyribonuclease VII small subunit [Oscillospiraceae bacterium]